MTVDLRKLTSAKDATAQFSWDALWALVDGNPDRLNITEECLDRHEPHLLAARISHPSGTEELTFGELAQLSSGFAHLLERRGIRKGDRVGVLMEPSRAFYGAMFGVIKRGAVAVPLYTLFGPDAVRERMADCGAALLLVDEGAAGLATQVDFPHLVVDSELLAEAQQQPAHYPIVTAASDLAVLQYTSGTSRQLPDAVPHDHRAVVTVARAALFALGLRAGDRYFCPSSPAWGHGLWHGTIAPWTLGIALGAYSGRFSTDRLVTILRELQITNLAAASTVYRMMLASGRSPELSDLQKASYTGEELSAADQRRFTDATGVNVCGMYGTTETGVVLVNFPGFTDHMPRPGALGKPMPGCELAVLDDGGAPVSAGAPGEIAVRRRESWFRSKDLGSVDTDGYFHYAGRADDIIISSGWTISPLEVERSLVEHPDVAEAAVVGTPDEMRGTIVAAYVVARRQDAALIDELQKHVRDRLGQHEYPRRISFLDALPKTVNGKIDRRSLRERSPVGGG